jgi:hypothetical protein
VQGQEKEKVKREAAEREEKSRKVKLQFCFSSHKWHFYGKLNHSRMLQLDFASIFLTAYFELLACSVT